MCFCQQDVEDTTQETFIYGIDVSGTVKAISLEKD